MNCWNWPFADLKLRTFYNAIFCDNRKQMKAVNYCHKDFRLRYLWARRSHSGCGCIVAVCVSKKKLDTSD